MTSVNLGKSPSGFHFLNLKIAMHLCVFRTALCVSVFYSDGGCAVGKDLRNCNTHGVNIPYDSRCHQPPTKPTIFTFFGIFVQSLTSYKNEENSHHHYLSRMLYVLCFDKRISFSCLN